jgi:hypothetical protein
METIVEKLKIQKASQNSEYQNLLKEANMDAMSTGCPIITENAIAEYLKYLIIKLYPTYDVISYGFFGKKKIERKNTSLRGNLLHDKNCFRYRFYRGDFYWMVWKETDIKNFVGTPPKHVLESVIKNKHLFDKIVIVTINKEKVVDPLVVGIKNNDPNRYLIDWWDKDIDPSELIKE